MFFLAGFICHITASFAFLIAILTRNWLSIYNVNGLTNGFVQRGIFYVCDVVSTNTVVQETLCVSILDAESGLIPSNRKRDDLALASVSIAIGCAGLSLIVTWLSAFYFNVRKKTTCTSCLLILTFLLLFITFSASAAVWILLIAETLVLGYPINRSMFGWPMWLAVGATGGFLVAFVFYLISFCKTICGRRKRNDSLYYAGNQY